MKVTFINKDEVVKELELAGWMASVSKDKDSNPLKVAEFCLKSGHNTPFRSCRFIFEIEGVSRAFSHEFVRHEIGVTKVQRSQRYVAEDNFKYVTPKKMDSFKTFINLNGTIVAIGYGDIQNIVESFYAQAIRKGIPSEDARYVLTNATCTKLRVAFDWEGLKNFCYRRCCEKAQWEIREVANLIREAVVSEFPFDISNILGKPCVVGKCPEKISCKLEKGEKLNEQSK